MIVVDTSILIDHLDGKPRATEILRRKAKRGPVLVTTLVAWELWKGAQTAQERSDVEALLAALETDPLTDAIARIAGELHVQYRQAGRERPAWDLLIAAHALHHDVPLATHDADFAPIESLELIPPRQT